MEKAIKGLIVPVLTPFRENGEVDERAFVRHLEFLSSHDVKRIMVNGTTGEFYSLMPEERKRLAQWARANFEGQIVLHVGGLGLEQNRIEVQWANEWADAVAVLPPIYPANLPETGVIEYFQRLEKEAKVPFIIYNFPKHTGNPVTAGILEAVPHFGLKDSAQNLELMEHTPRYFVGSSTNIFTPVQQGAAGFVSASANVRPELYAALETMLHSARVEEADLLQFEVKAYSAKFSQGGVPMLKQALARLLPDYPTTVRCPLTGL